MYRFSAILPNYNMGSHIDASLSCLLSQTHAYDEILIIDDGSTDDSIVVIERLIADKPNVRLVRNAHNKGVVATLNDGLTLVSGDYVHMTSANDTYHPRFIEYAAAALATHPDMALLCGNATFRYKETGESRDVFMHLPPQPHYIPPEVFHAYLRESPLTFFGGGIIMRKQAVREMKGLQEALKWHADWMLYYLLALEHGAYFIPEPLVNIEVSQDSYSNQAMLWSKQREVIAALLTVLARDYPGMQARWKSAALLPTYDIRVCSLLRLPSYRWYATPLLFWRLFVHSISYRLKYIFPRSLLIRLRPFFRV